MPDGILNTLVALTFQSRFMSEKIIRRTVKTTQGIEIFCRESVSNGTPLLCLHGKYGRGETWHGLMSRYGEQFRVISPDQRGHGLSEKPVARYSGEDFAADAHDLLEALDASPAIVVGHSIGGRNAAYLAALYPQNVKALVILDTKAEGPQGPLPIPPERIPTLDDLVGSWPTPYPSYQAALDDLRTRFPRETNVRYFLDSLVETVDGYDFLFSQHALSAIDACYCGWHQLLSQIRCPVLLMRADQSWYLSPEESIAMLKTLPSASFVEITGSDHMVYADNPDQFYPAFEQFLMTHRGSAS